MGLGKLRIELYRVLGPQTFPEVFRLPPHPMIIDSTVSIRSTALQTSFQTLRPGLNLARFADDV